MILHFRLRIGQLFMHFATALGVRLIFKLVTMTAPERCDSPADGLTDDG